MSELIVEREGAKGIYGVFKDDGARGSFYICEPEGRGVIRHREIYESVKPSDINGPDVEIEWSPDYKECRISIRKELKETIQL